MSPPRDRRTVASIAVAPVRCIRNDGGNDDNIIIVIIRCRCRIAHGVITTEPQWNEGKKKHGTERRRTDRRTVTACGSPARCLSACSVSEFIADIGLFTNWGAAISDSPLYRHGSGNKSGRISPRSGPRTVGEIRITRVWCREETDPSRATASPPILKPSNTTHRSKSIIKSN